MTKVRPTFLSLLPFVAAVIVFWPCLSNGYLALDDSERILSNPFVQHLDLSMVPTLFTRPFHNMYAPLPILIWWVNAAFLGGRPEVLHLLSVALHGVNGVLCFWLVYLLIESAPASLCVSVLFVVHPMRTEAVAWAIELTDIMSAACTLGALVAYTRYCQADSPKTNSIIVCYALFLLGLFSKLSVVFLPVMMLVIGRVLSKRTMGQLLRSQAPFWLTAAPFFIGSRGVALGVSAGWVSALSHAPDVMWSALRSASFGARKLFEPGGLSVLYSWSDVGAFDAVLLAALMGVLYFMTRARTRARQAFVVGAALYFLSLAPFSVAFLSRPAPFFDRYYYLPSIGLLTAIAAGAVSWFGSKKADRSRRYYMAAAWFIVSAYAVNLAGLAHDRCRYWGDDLLFWREAVRSQAKPTAFSLANLGAAIRLKGDPEGAMVFFEKAIEKDPDCVVAYYNRSYIYYTRGDYRLALADLSRLIELAPGMARAHLNRAIMHEKLGNLRAALHDAARAVELEPYVTEYAGYRQHLTRKSSSAGRSG